MTEEEWLDGQSCRELYDVVRTQATVRKVRLYMVACCRLKAALFFDPRIVRAIEAAEWCADDPQVENIVNAVSFEIATNIRPRFSEIGKEGEIAQIIRSVWRLLNDWWTGNFYRDVREAITHAAYLCLRQNPEQTFTGGAGNAAEYCARAIEAAESLQLGMMPYEIDDQNPETKTEIPGTISYVLREIFGNPFRPISINPNWLTPIVTHLATAA